MNLVRVLIVAIVAVLAVAGVAQGQQPDRPEPAAPRRTVPQASVLRLIVPAVPPLSDPTVRRWGVVTLLPPDTSGEFVRVSVPVGELLMRSSRALAAAQYRRAERSAHATVVRELRALTVVGAADLSGTWTLRWEPDFSGHFDEYDCTLRQNGRDLTLHCRDDPPMAGELQLQTVTLRVKAGGDGSLTATLTGEWNATATSIAGTWHLSEPDNRNGRFILTRR